MSHDDAYMLDTNVFNDVLDGRTSLAELAGRHVVVTGIQASELRATNNAERRTALLSVFKTIAPDPLPTSSFAFDIEGAGLEHADWNDGTGRFQEMLARLQTLDDKGKQYKNQTRDILIAETALKNGSVLISGDANLRTVMVEFGGRAISFDGLSEHEG